MSKHVDVTVRQGQLRGIVEENVLNGSHVAFRGIPYAKPPIGELRFRDPEPAEPWSDVRDASKFGNIAFQFDLIHQSLQGNEDCLYLNVYIPDIDLQTKRAVMVWIHSGAFHFSSDNHDLYGPDYIVRKDVVLVTINYRLGVLGFLNLRNEMAPGNQGLKDALMALRWVHDNISNFGGDPENVTIFGHGFGGSIVHYLALCPQADGLFHKAISQSGTAANTWAFSDKYVDRSFRLLKELGISTKNLKDATRFLKLMDAKDIVLASQRILTTNEQRQLIFPFVPTLDNDSPNPFFIEHPLLMIRRGVKVPFIIGFTTCEGSAFVRDMDDEALKQVNSNFASIIHPRMWPTLWQGSITAEDVRFRYFGNEPVSMETFERYINFISDMHFYRGIYDTVINQMRLDHRSTYMYHFSYNSKPSMLKTLLNIKFPETTFGEELFYLFYPRMSAEIKRTLGLNVSADREQRKLICHLTQMWTDFAKTGNPTPINTPFIEKWMPIEREDEFQYFIIDKHLWSVTTQKKNLRFFGIM